MKVDLETETVPKLNLHSDRKQLTPWAPRDHIQSHCKVKRRNKCGNVASVASISYSTKLKIMNFSGDNAWRCVATANHRCDAPENTDVLTAQTSPEFADGTLNQIWPTNNYCWVWIPQSSDNMTLYTRGSCYELRQTLSFQTFLGPPQLITVQKWLHLL